MVEKEKTGVWLAEQLGVTAVTVSKLCSNITQSTLPTLDKIAELLECELRDLIIEMTINVTISTTKLNFSSSLITSRHKQYETSKTTPSHDCGSYPRLLTRLKCE